MVTGIVLIGAMLMISVRRRVERRARATGTPRERLDEIKATAAARDESHALRAEMVETGTRLCAQIDARIERLEQLIRHADERLDLLERGGVADSSNAGAVTPAPASGPAVSRPTSGKPSTGPSVGPSNEPSTRPAGAPPVTSVSSSNDTAAPTPPTPPDVRDPLAAEISRLAADGVAPLEIAQRLDEPIGKIELILALARSGASRPS